VHYTQIFARTRRPTQILGSLRGLDVYAFPSTPAGTLVCERTSEALDARILGQVAETIARSAPVLAIAGDDGSGFWCGLFDRDERLRFEHNRLTGPRDFTKYPADSSQVGDLCEVFGVGDRVEEVYSALVGPGYESALERHAALALGLGLPLWSPGIGYSRVIAGDVPAEAGKPAKPPRFLRDLRPAPAWLDGIVASDSKEWFQIICQRAFGFLVEELGFEQDPEPADPYLVVYRRRDWTVVVEGLSYGGITELCVIDPAGHFVDLARMVERRDPELLDFCRFAAGQREQIPVYAEALRKCAVDILRGDYPAISKNKGSGPGFSFFELSDRSRERMRLLARSRR
jgi:hypothetical protein